MMQNDPNRADHSDTQSGDRTCIWRLLRVVEFTGIRSVSPLIRRSYRHGRPYRGSFSFDGCVSSDLTGGWDILLYEKV